MLSLALAVTAAALLQPGQAQPTPTPSAVRPPAGGTAAAATRDTTPATPRVAPVGVEAGDAGARSLLARARAARLTQDAALASYDAHTYQRFSLGLGTSAFSAERLLLRTENAAHVTWSRAAGVTVEQTGSRTVAPVASEAKTTTDLVYATPIPYFPGRETLWFPSPSFGVARPDVDPTQFIHPLANGSETYYRYALGESSAIRLPDGRSIGLRELRVTPRRPSPRLFVGSFWFDTASGHIVRAVYRMSVDFDLWAAADADVRRRLDSLATATVTASDTARGGRRRSRAEVERDIKEDKPPRWFTFLTGPVRATISAITVEYGLFEGSVWLPRRSVAEGEGRSGFFRMPLTLDERYRYDAVRVVPTEQLATTATPATAASPAVVAPTIAPPAVLRTPVDSALALATTGDSLARGMLMIDVSSGPSTRDERRAREARTRAVYGVTGGTAEVDSLLRTWIRAGDDLARRSDSLATHGDSTGARQLRRERDAIRRRAVALARRESQCTTAGATTYDAGVMRHGDGGPVVHVRRPCDPTTLASSPDLPKSAYDAGDTPLAAADRAALLSTLDGVVPGNWPSATPRVRTGLDLLRFNRVEGLSIGVAATTSLPIGYAADATVRLGTADLVPNAELGVSRTRGAANPSTLRVAVYHRLSVANDDYLNPFSFGASTAAALYGRDEGFYYRSWGAELRGTRPAGALLDPDAAAHTGFSPLALFRGAALGWRVFADEERGARAEVGKGLIGPRYVPNIAADRVGMLGLGGDLTRTFGADPLGTRVVVRARGEGAVARYSADIADRTAPFGRGLADLTVARPFGPIAASVTGGVGGVAGGRVPVQRLFYLGGLQTVRGHVPRPDEDGYAGREFWLVRSELGLGRGTLIRPVVFFDAGRASERAFTAGTTLKGAGGGLVLFDGLLRLEAARGWGGRNGTRVDASWGGRF